jgi:hypothetical protein
VRVYGEDGIPVVPPMPGSELVLDAMRHGLYATLETDEAIRRTSDGVDLWGWLMDEDKRYRPSLANDLMKPAGPGADAIVAGWLLDRELRRAEVFETRQGICRLAPSPALDLAGCALELAAAVAPHTGGSPASCCRHLSIRLRYTPAP